MKNRRNIFYGILILILLFFAVYAGKHFLEDTHIKDKESDMNQEEIAETESNKKKEETVKEQPEEDQSEVEVESEGEQLDIEQPEEATISEEETVPEVPDVPDDLVISWNPDWEYASYSAIHDSQVTLYHSHAENRKNFIVGLNAGHGTVGGSEVRTSCHPDGTPKVTGGSTESGATTATAIAEGTTFLDGTTEAAGTLELAKVMKEALLNAGYDVLMIRETEDCRLDNIARTVFANQCADCHIALHYDSSENDKGFFYISVPDVESYRNMEPVASHWMEHHALGDALLTGAAMQNIPLFQNGTMALDLTQTSYSTVPSVDLEVGDRASDRSVGTLENISQAVVNGLNEFTNR